MKFENYLNEKLADDLSPEQMDYYWKAIHAYNSWKKNQKNSMKVKNMLSFILMNFKLDDRATAKITNLKNTVDEYIKNGNLVIAPIKHREKKEAEPEQSQPTEVQYDESDYQTIEIDNEFCEKAFDKFNTKYFEGKLAKIPFELKDIPGVCGQFNFSTDFSNKRFIPNKIRINTNQEWTLSSFRDTLVHEMLHYYVDCYDNGLTEDDWRAALFAFLRNNKRKSRSILNISDATCHGGKWLELAKELNKKYPELSITRNTFISSGADKDKIKIINQLKEAYAVELYYMGSTKYPRFRIVNKEQLDLLTSFTKESPVLKRTENGSIDYNDPVTKFVCDLSISYGIGNNFTDVYVAKIMNPIPIASFPISDLNEGPYAVGKKEWQQMNHTQAFGKFKKIGEIVVKDQDNVKENYDGPTFKNWLNEKTQKKWDIEKLREMGLTDEEIEKLLSGDVEDNCSIT